MKIKIIVLINILGIFAYSSYGQCNDVEYLNPPPIGTDAIFKLQFVNEDLAYMIYSDIDVLKSSDGGNSWDTFKIDSLSRFTAIHFVNKDVGYISGDGFIKTVDGGKSWVKLNFGGVKDLQFLNENVGYAVGDGVAGATMWKTIDGGNTWEGSTVDEFRRGLGINFINEETGFITTFYQTRTSAREILWSTFDGGKNWQKVSEENGQLPIFVTAQIGFTILGTNKLMKTVDAGRTWTQIKELPFYPDQVYFTSEKIGFLHEPMGTLIKTTDGGQTWTTIKQTRQMVMHQISQKNSEEIYAGGVEIGNAASMIVKWRICDESILSSTKNGLSDLVNVYPVPAKESLSIELTGMSGEVQYQLINGLGTQVLSGAQTAQGGILGDINLTGLSAGLYNLRILAEGKEIIKKITIE